MPTQSNTRILEYGINVNSDNDCKIGERLQITCINPGRASPLLAFLIAVVKSHSRRRL
jgi:hypothetical protein